MLGAVALAGIVAFGFATSAIAGGTSLVAISRPSRGSAKVTYSSSDAVAGLAKGAGTSTKAISIDLFLRQGGATTTFVVPTGAYGGRAGWIRNDATRAQFLNRDAPSAPTGVARTTFSVGRRVKATAKSLGDENPLALSGAPAGDLAIAYVVTNGAEQVAHCAKFVAGGCAFTPLDGGTGWRLRCRDGVADPDCGARPVCGNGVHETASGATAARRATKRAPIRSPGAAPIRDSASRRPTSACTATSSSTAARSSTTRQPSALDTCAAPAAPATTSRSTRCRCAAR
jgi:hypothetical protein